MKRSMPVHNRLEKTWMKFRNQRFPTTIAPIITAMAATAHHK